MNRSVFFKNPIAVLGGAAAVGAVAAIVAAVPPGGDIPIPEIQEASPPVEAPDADRLNARIPNIGDVLEKHLFVTARTATGQNSFPDLVVKGVYVGAERSVILSLKSRPDANLRIWLGEVESTLNSITDMRDSRQALVTFLREWPIKEITRDGLTVEHYITGEVETYAVEYLAVNKVADDAERGYGQGIIPQGNIASANGGQNANARNNRNRVAQDRGQAAMGMMMGMMRQAAQMGGQMGGQRGGQQNNGGGNNRQNTGGRGGR